MKRDDNIAAELDEKAMHRELDIVEDAILDGLDLVWRAKLIAAGEDPDLFDNLEDIEWPREGVSGTYFVRRDGFVKIGRARCIRKRLVGLQVGHYEELELLCIVPESVFTEEQIHARFERVRYRGEWFTLTREIAKFALGFQQRNRNDGED